MCTPKWYDTSKQGSKIPISLLARIAIIAPNRLRVFVQFAVDVGANRMIAQVKIWGIHSRVTTPENWRNKTFKIIVNSCSLEIQGERFRWLLCWWTAATRLHGSKVCKFVLFQRLHEVEYRLDYNNRLYCGEIRWQNMTLYLFDRLLQSSDFTRQLLRRVHFSVSLS
jgi:hypothetical protein